MTDNKRDAEFYVSKLDTLLKADLNTKITEINTNKADGITLSTLNNNAYYYLTFGQRAPAYDPCILFSVVTDVSGEIGGLTSEKLMITIEIVTSDGGEADSLDVMKKLQRYRRAVTEVIIENYRTFPSLVIQPLPDIAFTLDNKNFFAIGVGMSVTYAL